jgi:hypothetical protein
MISHQTIGKDFDAPQPMGFGQGIEKRLIVRPSDKRRLSPGKCTRGRRA